MKIAMEERQGAASISESTSVSKQTLSRMERLLHSSSFKVVFRCGKCFRHPVMRIHFVETSRELPRLGLVVTRKMGKAVERNRIKRVLREVYRKSKSRLCRSVDLVLVPNASHGPATFAEYEEVFDRFVDWYKKNRARR